MAVLLVNLACHAWYRCSLPVKHLLQLLHWPCCLHLPVTHHIHTHSMACLQQLIDAGLDDCVEIGAVVAAKVEVLQRLQVNATQATNRAYGTLCLHPCDWYTHPVHLRAVKRHTVQLPYEPTPSKQSRALHTLRNSQRTHASAVESGGLSASAWAHSVTVPRYMRQRVR